MDNEGNGRSVTPGLVRVDDLDERLPESVFVLVLPGDDARGSGVELWRTHRQDLTAVAYSSIRGLVAACGGGQPWVMLTREQLEQVCDEHEITIVALDLPLPEGHRYPEVDSREQPDLPQLTELDADRSFVYVPSRPYRARQRDVVLELQSHRGRRTLLAYTSPEELERGCGPHQSWVAIPTDLLEEAAARTEAAAVLFNPVLSEDARHTGPVLDWTQA